jgi:hypothetical protein
MVDTSAYLLLEVMDKEPSLLAKLMIYGGVGIVGCALSRRRWWWGLLTLPLIGLYAWIDVGELRDPTVGAAILREAGYKYIVGSYAFMVAGSALPIASALLKRHSSATGS